jgi:hypothetical protein
VGRVAFGIFDWAVGGSRLNCHKLLYHTDEFELGKSQHYK